jgi:hypothetical protein
MQLRYNSVARQFVRVSDSDEAGSRHPWRWMPAGRKGAIRNIERLGITGLSEYVGERSVDLRQLCDIHEIQQLLATYVFAIDSKNYAALDEVFVPDATFDYTATGGIAGDYRTIKPWLEKALSHFPVTQHLIGLPLIDIQGDRATSRAMLINLMQLKQPNRTHQFFVGATYVDELIRTERGWRIARRVETDAWFKDPPTDFTPEAA